MARRIKPAVKHHPYMTLAAANFFLPYAKERGVSKVARGETKSKVTKEGFMQAYARVKGDPKKLVTRMATSRQSWAQRRDNFVGRHMAQMIRRGEKLWETSGKYKGWPTRRHLGLIMWAMTPVPTAVGRFIVSHEGSSAERRVIKPRTNGMSRYRKAVRATGKAIRIPYEWVQTLYQNAMREQEIDHPMWVYRGIRLPLNVEGGLSGVAAQEGTFITVNLQVGVGSTLPHPTTGKQVQGWWDEQTQTIGVAQKDRELRGTIRHELTHMMQSIGRRVVGHDYGLRKRKTRNVPPPSTPSATPLEFEAELNAALSEFGAAASASYSVWRMDTRASHPVPKAAGRRNYLGDLAHLYMERHIRSFGDARTRRHFTKKFGNTAAEVIDEMEAANLKALSPSPPAKNPRYTSAKRDDPELWEQVKAKVTRGTKGGKAGQWSARKAQFAVAEYQRLGGGYIGPKSPRNALAKWTREEWGTRSGKASLKTGERYLPKAAREALTPQEYAETTRAKRAGLRRGEQFTPQPERIARKTAKYRK